MRVISYRHAGTESYGFVMGDRVVPASEVGAPVGGVRELIVSGLPDPSAVENALSRSIALSDIDFLLPVVPEKVLCAGVNFPTHRAETGQDANRPEHPTIFSRFADSFVAHDAPLLKPAISDQFDYECELAIVIGKTAWQVTPEQALDHVFGYSCLNDGTVRDWQAHTRQWIPGKNWYRSGSIGPWIVTADEFGIPGSQNIRTLVNGEVRQNAELGEMIHSVAELIAYCSTFTPLHPGDIIAGGTTGGVGKYMEPQGFITVGDTVEVQIEGIGTLRNQVAPLPIQ